MSWQAYTDSLNGNADVASSAIVGYPDGGLWAASGLALQGTEGAAIAARFGNPRSGAKLVVGGVSYMATNCTEDFLTGKKGPNGVCITKSGKAVIICVSIEGINTRNTMETASKTSKDISSKGF